MNRRSIIGIVAVALAFAGTHPAWAQARQTPPFARGRGYLTPAPADVYARAKAAANRMAGRGATSPRPQGREHSR